MKTIVLAGALVAGMLVETASGLPFINKRAVVTEAVYVTETVANVVVYVDENGQPYSTGTSTIASSNAPVITTKSSAAPQTPSSSPAPPPVVPSLSVVASGAEPTSAAVKLDEPSSSSFTAQPPSSATSAPPISSPATSASSPPPPATSAPPPPLATSAPAPPPSPSAEAAPTTTPQPEVSKPSAAPAPAQPSSAAPKAPAVKDDYSGNLGLGITYDPYTGSQSSAQCKSAQDIANDFAKMKDYKAVRIYGNDCGMIPVAIENVLKNGQKLMGGVYMSHRGGGQDLSQVIQVYKDAIDKNAGGNWDVIQLFSVENERVNEHDMTASEVVDAINRARGQLRGLGYNGPVGAVETVPATIDNPAICQAADVVMVNCHAFFDSNTEAKNAGTFVKSQVDMVKKACNNKRVVVTESGWPHQGNANGAAVPSMDNQRLALDSIRQNLNSDMFLFNAFDSMWKSDWAGSFNAERFWGVIQ